MRISSKFGSFFTILALSTACADDEATRPGWPDPSADAGDTGDAGLEPVICVAGDEQPCECEAGGTGTQVCIADGSGFGECSECQDSNPPELAVCGDGVCELDENCWACEEDCGICLDCNAAPNCEGAAIPGYIDAHLAELDLPATYPDMQPLELLAKLDSAISGGDPGVRIVAAAFADPADIEHPLVPALREVFAQFPEQAAIVRRQLERAGMGNPASYREQFPDRDLFAANDLTVGSEAAAGTATNCEPAKLRIRVAKVTVHDVYDQVAKDKIYCAIITEATNTAEIRVTPTTKKLAKGQEYVFALAEGVVWGQVGEPVAPEGNLLVTYNCLEADDTSGFQKFLQAIADAALGATPIPSAYGWVIPVSGLAAQIIAAALALETDDHLFNASQIIPTDLQLEMTNGVWWSVQRKGKPVAKKWHWELRMEAWGCTDDGATGDIPETE